MFDMLFRIVKIVISRSLPFLAKLPWNSLYLFMVTSLRSNFHLRGWR